MFYILSALLILLVYFIPRNIFTFSCCCFNQFYSFYFVLKKAHDNEINRKNIVVGLGFEQHSWGGSIETKQVEGFHLQFSSEGGVWCLLEQGEVGWQVAMPPRGPAWGLV